MIRVREFTMKDAYSFHTSQEDLENYYDKCHVAYDERIYARAGIPEVVSVKSDSGMMAEMFPMSSCFNSNRKDSIVICKCDYRANMEAAENIVRTRQRLCADKRFIHLRCIQLNRSVNFYMWMQRNP